MIGDLVHQLDASGGPLVPVVERVVDKRSPSQQPVVDGPGVDADAGQVRLRADRLAEPGQQIPIELEDVPVQPVRRTDRVVGEACTASTLSWSGPTWPSITRPLEARDRPRHPPLSSCPSTGSGHIAR